MTWRVSVFPKLMIPSSMRCSSLVVSWSSVSSNACDKWSTENRLVFCPSRFSIKSGGTAHGLRYPKKDIPIQKFIGPAMILEKLKALRLA